MSEKALQQQQEYMSQENERNSVADNDSIGDIEISPMLAETIDDIGLNDIQKGRLIQAMSVTEQYSGPIPHPSIIEGYEKILPGAADRILSMAESEAQHRHAMDNKCHKTDSRDSLLGIICAFLLAMTCVIGGIIIIIKKPETVSALIGLLITGSGLGGVLATFIRGTKATWKLNGDKN